MKKAQFCLFHCCQSFVKDSPILLLLLLLGLIQRHSYTDCNYKDMNKPVNYFAATHLLPEQRWLYQLALNSKKEKKKTFDDNESILVCPFYPPPPLWLVLYLFKRLKSLLTADPLTLMNKADTVMLLQQDHRKKQKLLANYKEKSICLACIRKKENHNDKGTLLWVFTVRVFVFSRDENIESYAINVCLSKSYTVMYMSLHRSSIYTIIGYLDLFGKSCWLWRCHDMQALSNDFYTSFS